MSEGGDSKDINMKQKDLESSGGYRPKTEPQLVHFYFYLNFRFKKKIFFFQRFFKGSNSFIKVKNI